MEADCACPPLAEGQTVRLAVERRKKGKVVTVVRGVPAKKNNLAEVLTKLKSQCGAGGTIQDDALVIQGEHIDRIRELLSELGYVVST